MEIEFRSLEELYNHLKPVLKTKYAEMRRCGYTSITLEDIWEYLKEVKWKNSKNLYLYQMVSYVIHIENHFIDQYFQEKLEKEGENLPKMDE